MLWIFNAWTFCTKLVPQIAVPQTAIPTTISISLSNWEGCGGVFGFVALLSGLVEASDVVEASGMGLSPGKKSRELPDYRHPLPAGK